MGQRFLLANERIFSAAIELTVPTISPSDLMGNVRVLYTPMAALAAAKACQCCLSSRPPSVVDAAPMVHRVDAGTVADVLDGVENGNIMVRGAA
jgi:hypothetical protein